MDHGAAQINAALSENASTDLDFSLRQESDQVSPRDWTPCKEKWASPCQDC